ncbi:MAG TPA: DUF58 domain-containing protein [Geobacteraceae bacterium]
MNTGNNLLFLVVSALLGFMAVSGVLGWANIQGLQLACTLPDEVYAGRQTLLTVHLKNTKRRLPSFLLRVEILGRVATLPVVSAAGEGTVSFTHAFPERGLRSVGECRVLSPFPVNFFVRGKRGMLPEEVAVFPAPRACPPAGGDASKGNVGTVASPLKGYDGDIIKIADYTGGEPLKMIHWRLSAKHDELKVKELASASALPVVLDPALLPARTVEEQLSCAAYLVNRLMGEGRPVGLRTRCETIAPALSRGHRLRLLKELAVYGQG